MCRSVKSENVVEFIPESHHRHYCLIEAGAPADVQRSKSNSNQKTPNNSTSRTRHNRHTSFNVFRLFFLKETKQPKDGSFCSTFQIDAGRSKQPKQKKSLSLVDTERELDSTDRTEHIDTLNKSS